MDDRRMAAAYDRIAPIFAARNAAMPGELAALGRDFLALAGDRGPVLEVGCGTGRDMAWLEARGAAVIGVDLSGGMLAEARRIARGPLLRMDMRRLAFAGRHFGGVWCMAALLHLPKGAAREALREMHRALVPGGALALTLQEGAGEGWERGGYDHEVERYFARYIQPEAAALLRASGFAVHAWTRNAAGARRWLGFLARA